MACLVIKKNKGLEVRASKNMTDEFACRGNSKCIHSTYREHCISLQADRDRGHL